MRESQISPPECGAVIPGALDNLTIMRYTHSYRDRQSGGVEQYLRCVNRGLLERHRLTVLQTYLVDDFRGKQVEVEQYGLGRVVWVPVAIQLTEGRFRDLPARARYLYDQTLQLCRRKGEPMSDVVLSTTKAFLQYGLEHLRHRCVVISDMLPRMLLAQKVDLLCVHWFTYDVDALILEAQRAGIPFVVSNHFDNGLFSEPHMRRWLPHAAGIGSVSSKGIPNHVHSRCVNLLDAVDTEFFAPEKVWSQQSPIRPMILIPALVKNGKGHLDLLRAASILAARKLEFEISCAGAVESQSLYKELREYATMAGLEDRVSFLGELRQEEMRTSYALSSLVVLPTYWEGLGRSLLEAQAMKKPVVAYDSGGVSETVLPDKTGFLVKTGDVEALADRMEFLLVNEAERRRMGERGRRFVVEKFGVAGLIERHESFYLDALSKRQPYINQETRS